MIIITDNAKYIPDPIIWITDVVAEKKPDDSFYLIVKDRHNLFWGNLPLVGEIRVEPSFFEEIVIKSKSFVGVISKESKNIDWRLLFKSSIIAETSEFWSFGMNCFGFKISKDELKPFPYYVDRVKLCDVFKQLRDKEREVEEFVDSMVQDFEDSFGSKISQAVKWTGDNISEVWSLCPFVLLSKEGNLFVPKDAGAKYHSFAIGENITLRKNWWLIKDEFGKFHTAQSKE